MNLEKKTLIISIIGLPNAGKSTFINTITKEKISGVSPRVQTTRNSIRGIRNFDNTNQLVFIDSPGVIEPKNPMDNFMMNFYRSSLKESDLFLVLLDIRTINSPNFQNIIMENIKKYNNKKKILVINKIDFFNKSDEDFNLKKTEIEDRFNSKELNGLFDNIFYISLLEKIEGLDILIEYLKNQSITSPWLYDDEDQISDSSDKFLASEITREKIFNILRMELPYSTLVRTDQFEESDEIIKIYQTIFVNKKAHKSILIGANGSMLKKIGINSRIELEHIFGKKIHLELYVKVKEGWTKNEGFIKGTIGFEGS
jgi:GTP-binding protein Era